MNGEYIEQTKWGNNLDTIAVLINSWGNDRKFGGSNRKLLGEYPQEARKFAANPLEACGTRNADRTCTYLGLFQ